MRVICNGHKTCTSICAHGIAHVCDEVFWNDENPEHECNCVHEYYIDTRKKKLEKLKTWRLKSEI